MPEKAHHEAGGTGKCPVAQALDGEAQLTIGGRKVTARAGQAVLMPANVPHALKAPGRFKMLLTMFKAN